MEEQKLLKRKKKALNGTNRKQIAELCTELGDFYNGKTQYENALSEYTESANIYQELNLKLENARSHRMIGEMYMLLAEFEKALKHEDIYLSIVRNLENKVEEQRALATLGRAFLLQGQSLGETEEANRSLKAAEKAFMKSLLLCESLKNKVNNQELMDMRARLLLNIGVVLEQLNIIDRAAEFLQKAITICKTHDLYDLLNQCYITEGIMYSVRKQDYTKSLSRFNFALEVAGRLDNKVVKQCEALSLKAGVLCKMSDFQSAKAILMKAWKLKTPDISERDNIERKLKTVAALCYTEDLLVTSDSNDHETMKKLYEKLGDGACSLKSYQKGIFYYLKMLEHAEKNGDMGKLLIPIYVSLYQTYQDIKDYKNVLVYQKKEFELIQDDPSEAFSTLINIAETVCQIGDMQQFEKICEQAGELARKDYNEKGEIKVIKFAIKHYKNMNLIEKAQLLEKELSLMGAELTNSSDEDQSSDEETNTPNIGDDICIENLTDVSDDDNEENDRPRVARKRGKGFTIKKNTKGETQLHQACISGNTLLVTRLISQGHPVNVRDNAGWLPLHEACIHGKKEIVEILLKNGAHINDRGGTQCDGITPMHDAASNGYLEIVEFLLDYGASPSLKNDHGQTVLDFLKSWRRKEELNPSEQLFYETLCARLHRNVENSGSISQILSPLKSQYIKTKTSNLSLTKTHPSPRRGSTVDCLKTKNREKDGGDSDDSISVRNQAKYRNIIDDDSSNSSVETNIQKSSGKFRKTGVHEYRNAIQTLRNRFNTNDTDSDQENRKDKNGKSKKGALLDPEEVGDDWLEEDILSSNSKKRKRNNSVIVDTVKRKSKDSIKIASRNDCSIESDLPHELVSEDLISSYGFIDNICPEDICDSDSNSMDAEIMHRENIPPFVDDDTKFRRSLSTENLDKQNIKKKRWKHQSTLIKSGFTRKKSDSPKVHSTSYENCIGSDSETHSNLSLSSNKSVRNLIGSSEEPDSTSEQILQCSFDRLKSIDIQNSQFVRTESYSSYRPLQPPLPPAAVRVRIQDKLLLIPVAMDKIDSLTIDWLSKEVSRRYYNIEGVQPSLNLLTCDGAILADEDPLSLVIGSTELQASITSWNLPPVGERYIECCAQLKIDIDDHLRNMLECSQATHSLSLPNLSLSPPEIQPVFKSLNHQTNLTHLILCNNNLGNEGFKYLTQCLPTLAQIKAINLSGNSIDADGLKNLLYLFEKPNTSTLQNHLELDLSYNPLGDNGLKHIMKLTNYVKLKSLILKECDITSNISENSEILSLKDLEVLDLGFNSFNRNFLRSILISLDPLAICALRLEGLPVNGEFFATFMDNCTYSRLMELDLSRCNLTDADITQILRSLSKCEELQTIKLCYNRELTVLSLKKLIQHSPSFTNVNLEGCGCIFKYLQEQDMRGNWFRDTQHCKIRSLKITSENLDDNSSKFSQLFSAMWVDKWEGAAHVGLGIYGQMHLSAT